MSSACFLISLGEDQLIPSMGKIGMDPKNGSVLKKDVSVRSILAVYFFQIGTAKVEPSRLDSIHNQLIRL